ncbi:MAG TPA: DNA primase, partial [Ramlibacter sp.]|nr:DNA primase [Ramlibacter sp.]
ALPYATDVRTVKFLFLPPEHDPDSYIREHGHDAFARCIGDAVPLSRFLIEASREGCDLNTAEGRAHMAANAKPLWSQLPDGALKRQLLAEIAELAQLTTRELEELWTGRKAAPARQEGGGWRKDGERKPWSGERKPWKSGAARDDPHARTPLRAFPMNRATRALQILFADPAAWERLSHEDHHLLCELPAPHGALFAWLDSQHHEHGPQPWDALRQALSGHEHEQFVIAEMAKVPPQIESDAAELMDILAKERKRRDDEERARLAAAAGSDPEAFERLKALVERQKPGAKA